MKPKLLLGVSAFLLTLCCAASADDAPRPGAKPKVREPLVEQVRGAIGRGVQFLRDQQTGRDNWEVDVFAAASPGGETALALLALLNAGVKPDDPAVQRGLKYLRTVEPQHTYVAGLQTMVFAAAGKDVDRVRIQRNIDWLVEARVMHGNALQGWGYTQNSGGADNSNTQYALLGLHDGHQAGAKVERAVWES